MQSTVDPPLLGPLPRYRVMRIESPCDAVVMEAAPSRRFVVLAPERVTVVGSKVIVSSARLYKFNDQLGSSRETGGYDEVAYGDGTPRVIFESTCCIS